MQAKPLGEILAQGGWITKLQLSEALQVQKEELSRIGEVLVSLGFVTKQQIRQVIRDFKKRIPLGEYLLEAGVISSEDLDHALHSKSHTRKPLGQILVEANVIDEEQLAKFLSMQLDMPYIEPFQRMVDISLFNRLPRTFITHNVLLPLCEANGTVTVVVPGLPDESTSMQLTAVYGDSIELAISTPSKIQAILRSLVSKKSAPIEFADEDDGKKAEENKRIDLSEVEFDGGGEREHKAAEWLNYLVNEAIRDGASDVHIESMPDDVRVRFRINGLLTNKTTVPLSARASIFRRIKALSGMKFSDSFRDQEGRLQGKTDNMNVDFRISTFVGINGESINMRLFSHDEGLIDLTETGILPNAYGVLRRTLDTNSGLIVFSGPPGSGKTMSLLATLNKINERHLNIVTVEDPVEFHLPGVIQTSVSSHRDATLAEIIESAVHQDPDVIMIGEVGEDEEVRVALRAALTGFKVLTTFNANDVLGALIRLGKGNVDKFLQSSISLTIVCQRLVRKICDNCRAVIQPEPRLIAQFPIRDFNASKYDFCHGMGCEQCNNTGYRGRVALMECLTITEEIRQAFEKGAAAPEFLQLARSAMPYLTIPEVGVIKAVRQITTVEEVIRVSPMAAFSRGDSRLLSFQEIEHISESTGISE